jgi:organic hydroperoxide reductase OsmC/OhrA
VCEAAHLICPYSNAMQGNVAITTSVQATPMAA